MQSGLTTVFRKLTIYQFLNAVYDGDLTVVGYSLKARCSMQWSNPCTHVSDGAPSNFPVVTSHHFTRHANQWMMHVQARLLLSKPSTDVYTYTHTTALCMCVCFVYSNTTPQLLYVCVYVLYTPTTALCMCIMFCILVYYPPTALCVCVYVLYTPTTALCMCVCFVYSNTTSQLLCVCVYACYIQYMEQRLGCP